MALVVPGVGKLPSLAGGLGEMRSHWERLDWERVTGRFTGGMVGKGLGWGGFWEGLLGRVQGKGCTGTGYWHQDSVSLVARLSQYQCQGHYHLRWC